MNDPDQENVPLVVTGDVNTDELGIQTLTYTATDAYGRKAQVTRNVTVIPVYTTNEVQYDNSDKNLSFSIGINEAGTGFTLNSLSTPETTPEETPGDATETTPQETPENQPESVSDSASDNAPTDAPVEEGNTQPPLFEFSVYNQNGILQKKVEIIEEASHSITLRVSSHNSDETISQITTLEELKQVLSAIQVRPEYYFATNASDLSKLKVTGKLDKKEESQTELNSVDYSQLTHSNRDVVENVRFKLTDNIVEVVYNQAPVITIQPAHSDEVNRTETDNSTTLTRNKALSVADYDLLSDVIVSDDKDNLTLTVDNVTVANEMLVSELDASVETIGQDYIVTYRIKDSWGRQSNSVTRQVTIQSAMDDVEVKFHRIGSSLEDKGVALTIGFDMSTKRFNLDWLSTNNAFKDATGAAYGTLSILSPAEGNSLYKGIFGHTDNGINNPSEFTNTRTNTPSVLANALQDIEVTYGTKFNFQMLQVSSLFIDGSVINSQEDYSKGSQLGAVLKESMFVVTPEGLKQEYSGIQVNSQNFSQLTWLSGVAGNQSFNLMLDTSNQNDLRLKVEALEIEPLDTKYSSNIFRLSVYNPNGTFKNGAWYNGRNDPSTIKNHWDNFSVAEGGYITISSLVDRRLSNFKWYNLQPLEYFPENINYTEVITDRTYFDDVRFYITKQGIVPVYNAAPVFRGASETDVIIGSSFNTRDGVTVTDDHDTNISQFTVSPETISTDTVGQQTITYTTRDSWGRTTTHERIINVRPKVFENKVQVFSESDKVNPAFEIVLDNLATQASSRSLGQGVYRINRLNNEMLDENRPTQEVFKIWIMSSSNAEKVSVKLLGRDTATSEKLNKLAEVTYESGDYIKVWRAPSADAVDDSIDTLKITGTIRGEDGQDYTDGSFNVEYMNNVVFQVPDTNQANLKAIYNKAPEFIGVNNQTIYYGDTFDPLNDVDVEDDKDPNLTLSEQNVSHNVNPNRIGEYPVTYTFTDSWGRTTSQTITVKVISKVTKNMIEVHGDNGNGQTELKFTIGFNEAVSRLTIIPNQTAHPLQISSSLDLSDPTEMMSLIVYNRFGQIKQEILIMSTDTIDSVTQKFSELSQLPITSTDSLSVTHINPVNIKIKGTVNDQSQDYSTEIAVSETMKNRRFKFSNNGLTETEASKNNVIFSGLEPISIIRGDDDFNPLENVSVEHSSEVIEQISVEGFEPLKVGLQEVTYKVVDSWWGTVFTDTRQITVLPYNSLETVQIQLQHPLNNNSLKLLLDFDAIEMKIIPSIPKETNDSKWINFFRKMTQRLTSDTSLDEEITDGEENGILDLVIFSTEGNEKYRVSVTTADLSNIDNLNTIFEDLSFEYGDLIGIETSHEYDYLMNGPVAMPINEQLNKKSMKEVRYYITEDGLNVVQNEAPTVVAKNITQRVGEEINFDKALTVQDDHDGNSIFAAGIEDTTYDEYVPGQYSVTYVIIDSWGLESRAIANISVQSDIDQSFMILKNNNQQELVKLGFDSVTRKLIWSYNSENSLPITSLSDETQLFKLSIYTANGQQQGQSITFQGKDTITTIQEKVSHLQSYQYTYENQIHIEVAESAKELVSITNVLTAAYEQLEGVDYEAGVENVDFFTNVRFQIMYDGLYANYNEAPVLEVTKSTVESEKKVNVEDYELLESVVVTDDKDLYDDIKVRVEYYNTTYPEGDIPSSPLSTDGTEDINNPTNPKRLQLGTNTIKYIAIDSWGRESNPQSVTLNLVSAMDNVKITFLHAANGLKPDFNKIAMELKFDMANKQLKMILGNTDVFKFNQIQYGAMSIKNPTDNTPSYTATFGTQRTYETGTEFQNAQYGTNHPQYLEANLNNYSIDYGTEIKIKIYQSPFVYINGTVINAQEDYSQGATIAGILNESTFVIAGILNESTFVITEEGLVQKYETNIKPTETMNTIAWYSGVSGNLQFKLDVNPTTERLTLDVVDSKEPLDTLYKSGPLFSIYVYNSDGVQQYGDTFNGGQVANDVRTVLHDQSFSIANGDYLVIKILPTNRDRKSNFRIYGHIDRENDSLNQIDYERGVPDVAYYNESRFYFTNNGLRLDYNEAPVFTGLTDVMLMQNAEFRETVNLKTGVDVSDDNTPGIPYTIQDSSGREISNADNYSPTSLGAVEVYYVATDSLGRMTKEPRFIWLQSPSTIEVNDENKLTVQEGDPTLRTEEAVYKYLIDLVTVSDIEDDDVGMPIKVTKDNITTDFNPMIPGPYDVTYTVRDSDGNESTETFTINVVRSINVTVPRNNIPFQVVTNLLGENTEGKEFISGTVKIQNNYLTDVNVSVKSLTINDEQSNTRDGIFELVQENSVDWNNLSEEDTMSKLALGLYHKSGLNGNNIPTKDNPIWLTVDMPKTTIGVLPKRDINSSTPTEAILSFTGKYGKNFTSGKHRMKFNLVLEFE